MGRSPSLPHPRCAGGYPHVPSNLLALGRGTGLRVSFPLAGVWWGEPQSPWQMVVRSLTFAICMLAGGEQRSPRDRLFRSAPWCQLAVEQSSSSSFMRAAFAHLWL